MPIFRSETSSPPRRPAATIRLPAFAAALLCAVFALSSHAADERDMNKRAAPCMACHGKEGRAASDGYYPRIAGKPAGYLYNQLVNFRDGRRQQYPLMTHLVQHLSDDYLKEIAEYFSALHAPYPPAQSVEGATPQLLEKGRALVVNGDPARNIPSCASCHGEALTGVVPSTPSLLGIPRDYINSQFGAWREGTRRAAAPDCMGQIAKQLAPEEVSAVSAWLASQSMPADPAPSTKTLKLPVACGSVQGSGR
ncbi:c-type cytochrome [Noviherbaspirillum galbum]|uniref:C-type cytochrome n=1 Tax=Noviherbaspirillum galbum TaxID=2709383 RepID=A0A6B3SYC1_9BURK|nr:c-type cytochrome [Noviherbaspirillum galbum]NEX62919.1 c-type cytochrome [Noviherbaspirillum galbum]